MDTGKLRYGIFGMITVREVVPARSVEKGRWIENAHTRRDPDPEVPEWIVRGDEKGSGRFQKLIDIGEYRDRAYRVRGDILDQWGGISLNDGYIQRSAVIPTILDPKRFLDWLDRQSPDLINDNGNE